MGSTYKKIRDIVFKRTTPLCFLPNGELVCFRDGSLLIINKDKVEKTIPMQHGFKENALARFKAVNRLLRLGIRTAIAMDDDHIIVSYGNIIKEVDLTNGHISKGYKCEQGTRPLIFTKVKGIKGFEDGFYYGDYIGRLDKMPVKIYRRTGIDNWEAVYTFSTGLINHIHNIIPDPYRNCLWIMTGDFGEAAAFWKATDMFTEMERVACNDQKYRGCVGFVLKEGILYATDSPLTQNHIYLFNPSDKSCREISAISGACIDGCQWKDGYVGSTTVEPDVKYKNKLDFIFKWKIGAGIHDRQVRIYYGNLDGGFEVIHKEKKDWLPFIFQFCTVKFPVGENNSDSLYFMPIASKKHDMSLISIRK